MTYVGLSFCSPQTCHSFFLAVMSVELYQVTHSDIKYKYKCLRYKYLSVIISGDRQLDLVAQGGHV